ncbi:hypothetical protein [Bradyrhizobium sp. LHD-71]|uniref:hypothetical protein n=1 Tax=Bradyrhizobium sp. LHD-71 TaxID=3072141 RepID=UPI00280F3DEF|nr:hypothetical protein [Bradyrhizobium sp. LHD-71]MDQ8727784.1 hypothetical protein [Bradyrhizobium sp. LHD-71]
MRRVSILAVAGLVVTAVAAASPAQANYSLIRWEGTGFCQIWDDNIPTRPFPSNYTRIVASLPTFFDALSVKEGMMRTGTCNF